MRKYFFSLIVLIVFFLSGTLFGTALDFIPASAVYAVSFDLKRIASLTCSGEMIRPSQQKMLDSLRSAGSTRLTIAGGNGWNVVLIDFSCPRETVLALLAGNGVLVNAEDVNGQTFYKADQWQFWHFPSVKNPMFTFLSENVLAVMEQSRISAASEAMRKKTPAVFGQEIVRASIAADRMPVPKLPQVEETMKMMLRGSRRLFMKLDSAGAKQEDILFELGSECKNADSANFAAYMLPVGMVMGLNLLCASDAELCNRLAGAIEPGVSGKTAYARLRVPPELLPRIGNALQNAVQTLQKQKTAP